MNSTSSIPSQISPRSQSQASGGRRPTSRVVSSSYMPASEHCAAGPDSSNEQQKTRTNSPSLGQRSVSLTTLQPVIQPRMAQLETLEAKMASIEVSLSSTPRRKKNGSLNGLNLGSSIRINKELATKELENLRSALRDKENIIQNLKEQLTVPLRLNGTANNNNNNNRELSANEKKQAEDRIVRLKLDVDNKRLAIKNLKIALERLDITEKNFSNIDVRIQQAELEYQLGREELNLLSLLEEIRTLQFCLEESNKNSTQSHTLFSSVNNNGYHVLQALEVNCDPKSPKFVAGQKESVPGLWIDWSLEETGMCKGDRLIEVNGKIVLTKTLDDLSRLLAAAPDPAQIVILRKFIPNEQSHLPPNFTSKEVSALRSELDVVKDRAEEAQRAKDGLRSDNIRLTHRISYLEEQVSELLTRRQAADADIRIVAPTPVISTVKTNQNVTNINITSNPTNGNGTKDLQVFQKGSQITTLIPGHFEAKEQSSVSLPARSKSSMSNVSNTHISAASSQNGDFHCHRSHRHKHHRSSRNSLHSSNQNVDQTGDKLMCRKHHHHREKEYNSETNSTVDHVARYNKRNSGYSVASAEKEYASDVMDQSYKRATKIVHELTRTRPAPTLYEKHRQKCITASEKYDADILKHYNARKSASVLDFRAEVPMGKYVDSKSAEELDKIDKHSKSVSRLYKKIQDARSVKSLDFDSDCNSTVTSCHMNGHAKSVDYTSEPIESKKLSQYYGEHMKPRPTPPKKPLRLSLHKTQSLQSVETPPPTPHDSPTKSSNESRKSVKRNYKGELPICVTVKAYEHQNGELNGHSGMKWMHFNKHIDSSSIEKGSWC